MVAVNLDALEEIVVESALIEVMPRFRTLATHEITHKRNADGRAEIVTVADRAMEARLVSRLEALLPGSRVVGEEAVASAPEMLSALSGRDPVWVVDPIDGTANFAEGLDQFGTMVALIVGGEIQASTIHLPMREERWSAQRGGGVRLNGIPFTATRLPSTPGAGPIGILQVPEHDPKLRAHVEALVPTKIREAKPGWCAATAYVGLVDGEFDFALFSRLMPWDHAPGVLLVKEIGGIARKIDGLEYDPTSRSGLLLSTHDPALWGEIRTLLSPSEAT